MIRSIGATALAALLWAAPVAAQDVEAPDDTSTMEEAAEAAEEVAEETADVAEETADVAEDVVEETAEAVGEAAEEAEEAVEAHDWEFALSATDRAPGASGEVRVTEGDAANTFVLDVSGLPTVDELDEENRDVNAYTVWIVPSKERVREATLAGVLDVTPESGAGTFEGSTELESFGLIVTATVDGAPASIGGIPVLTGIPVTAADAAAVEDVAEAADEAGEALDEAAEATGDETTEAVGEALDEAGEDLDEAAEEMEEEAEDVPAPEPPGRR